MATIRERQGGNFIRRGWNVLKNPRRVFHWARCWWAALSRHIFWGGFNTAMEATNNEDFCISCHEMKDNVYKEYRDTIHYNNRTGVRATCPDCPCPRNGPQDCAQNQASNELLHKALGSIDTRRSRGQRLTLARHVWDSMKRPIRANAATPHYESMDFTKQGRRACRGMPGPDEGKTCIDCHKGIAPLIAGDVTKSIRVWWSVKVGK